jgi:hypothetical protein
MVAKSLGDRPFKLPSPNIIMSLDFPFVRLFGVLLDIPIRFPENQPQQIPFWTGYNSGLSEYKSECSVVSYAPIIESKPNDMELPLSLVY